MIENQRQDSWRRVQIGLIGIVAVLLLVGLANMALQRVSDEAPVAGELPGTADPTTADAAQSAPKEPLAELGVTPSQKSAKIAPQHPSSPPPQQ